MTAQHTCAGKIWAGIRYRPCGKTAAHEHEGVMYCKTHHPPTVQAKAKQRQAEWEAEYRGKVNAEKAEAEKKAEEKRRAECFPELIAALQVVLRDYAAVHDIGDIEMQPAIYQARAAIQKATNKDAAIGAHKEGD